MSAPAGENKAEERSSSDNNDNGKDPPEQGAHYNEELNIIAWRNYQDPGKGWKSVSFEHCKKLISENGTKIDMRLVHYQQPVTSSNDRLIKTMMQRLIGLTGYTGIPFEVLNYHFGNPVAIMGSIPTLELVPIKGGIKTFGGLVTTIESDYKGKKGFVRDEGHAVGLDLGLTMGITQYYYTGNIDKFLPEFLEGSRRVMSASYSVGKYQMGISFSWSKVHGGYIIGYSKSFGLALPVSAFSGNYSYDGKTKIIWK